MSHFQSNCLCYFAKYFIIFSWFIPFLCDVFFSRFRHFFCQFLWTEKNTPPSYSLFKYIRSVFRILGHILKFRVKSWRCRDSGRANQHQRHLDFGPSTRRRSAESILSTAHICNLLPLVLTCAAVQVKSITSTCLSPPPTQPPFCSPTAVTVGVEEKGGGGGEIQQ